MGSLKVFLGGLNSTGKTELLKSLSIQNHGIITCQGSKEFFKWLKLDQGDYESLEKLSDDYKNQELGKMIPHLVGETNMNFRCKMWVFAGHFGRINNDKVISAIGDWISHFDLIVILSADPKILIRRTINDFIKNGRRRNIFMEIIEKNRNPETILKRLAHQSEKISEQISLKYDIPLIKLNGSCLGPKQLAEQLLKETGLIE